MRWWAVILLLWTHISSAQLGNYQSLNRSFDARNAALGGKVVSLSDGDIMQFVHNPAILDSVQAGAAAINFSPYFADIYSFSGAYITDFNRIGKWAFGLSYIDYGDFQETADNGDITGDFKANDLVMVIGKSHQISSFTLGANIKLAANNIAGYGSSLLLADLGGVYRAPNADFSVGLVFKNFGFVLPDYTGSSAGQVPFDVQISTSLKPKYMPFRFSISAYNLTNNDAFFQIDQSVSQSKSVAFADKILRKVNFGTEFIIHESIQFLFGYSHMMQQELKIDDIAYGAGFSYGLSIRIKQFRIRYSHASYTAAGGTDFFTLLTNFNSFKKIL